MTFVSTSEDDILRNVHPLCRTISPQSYLLQSLSSQLLGQEAHESPSL